MNTAKQVSDLVKQLKADGVPLSDAAWEVAKACVGWPYVFGAWGAECTPAERRKRYREDHETIKTACQVLSGKKSDCIGCKWYPDCERVRCFDCRGFTEWIIETVYGFKLQGGGATSQWNDASNWKAKGLIADGMPKDTLVYLFYPLKSNPKKMAHTGLGYHGETVECSAGVQYFSTMNKKWTHWAVPKCIDGDIVLSTPASGLTPDTNKPTLRRGSKGEYVKELQKGLQKLGYNLGPYGVDGDFGRATEAAVRAFQMDRGLKVDGICGPATWAALDSPSPEPTPEPVATLYTVHIPHLTEDQANGLIAQYPGSWKTTE